MENYTIALPSHVLVHVINFVVTFPSQLSMDISSHHSTTSEHVMDQCQHQPSQNVDTGSLCVIAAD